MKAVNGFVHAAKFLWLELLHIEVVGFEDDENAVINFSDFPNINFM
jgi:hypothetical protein